MEKSFNKTNKRGKCPTCPGGHLPKRCLEILITDKYTKKNIVNDNEINTCF